LARMRPYPGLAQQTAGSAARDNGPLARRGAHRRHLPQDTLEAPEFRPPRHVVNARRTCRDGRRLLLITTRVHRHRARRSPFRLNRLRALSATAASSSASRAIFSAARWAARACHQSPRTNSWPSGGRAIGKRPSESERETFAAILEHPPFDPFSTITRVTIQLQASSRVLIMSPNGHVWPHVQRGRPMHCHAWRAPQHLALAGAVVS
jgi:hypothetical protein